MTPKWTFFFWNPIFCAWCVKMQIIHKKNSPFKHPEVLSKIFFEFWKFIRFDSPNIGWVTSMFSISDFRGIVLKYRGQKLWYFPSKSKYKCLIWCNKPAIYSIGTFQWIPSGNVLFLTNYKIFENMVFCNFKLLLQN